MFLVISYDISDDKSRQRVAKILGNFGQRVQYSVFECDLSKDELNKLITQLENIINDSTDSIRYYRICKLCKDEVRVIGKGEIYMELPYVII